MMLKAIAAIVGESRPAAAIPHEATIVFLNIIYSYSSI